MRKLDNSLPNQTVRFPTGLIPNEPVHKRVRVKRTVREVREATAEPGRYYGRVRYRGHTYSAVLLPGERTWLALARMEKE